MNYVNLISGIWLAISLIGIFIVTPYLRAKKYININRDSDATFIAILCFICWPMAAIYFAVEYILKTIFYILKLSFEFFVDLFYKIELFFTPKKKLVVEKVINEAKSDYRKVQFNSDSDDQTLI